MLARSLWALSLAVVLSLSGCGLTLDVDPPDVTGDIDGGHSQADGGAREDAGPVAECAHDVDCDDASWCNGQERCEAGVCKAGETPCPDPSACFLRTCDDELEVCGNAVSICAGDEICTPDGVCVPPPACTSNADCPDDRDECNGSSVCEGGRCLGVPPPVCEGGVGCVRNECVPLMGCMPVARHELCDDSAACTENLCAPGRELADADGCVFRPNDALCPGGSDGTTSCGVPVCVGGPLASDVPGSGCGLRLDSTRCPVGQRCTLDSAALPICTPLPVAACAVSGSDVCNDGNPCNGQETCRLGACASESRSCPDDGCREGWCDLRTGVPTCALRPTAACDSFSAP